MMIDEKEKGELLVFHNRNVAIDLLFERCLNEQQSLIDDKDKWFYMIREKYKLPSEQAITINHITGEIAEEERSD